MGDILKHITALLDEGRFFIENRPKYPLPNYFDALDGLVGCGPTGTDKKGGTMAKDITQGKQDTSNPLRRGDNSTII
jgi:hypothetical protein